jgi:ATP-dependent Clp protease ATP-binding subunit ClpB
MEIDSMPTELDELERTIRRLQIEEQAVKKEKDPASKERLKGIEKEISELSEKRAGLQARWMNEKEAIKKIRELKEKLEQARGDAERAEREGNLGRAAELRYGTIVELNRELEKQNEALSALQAQGSLLKEEVDEEDIAEIVSKWTGVPVSKMLESEMVKLTKMEERLRERVVGQDEAVVAVSDAVRRARAGIQDPDRPIGSFIFLGPTGVGKTELARALAEFLFDDEKAMIRIDMSEYQEKHTVSRLIGAPPGYVGFEEGGQLTEAVRRRPYSAILFDEIEKAHPEVFNVLLQLLEDGRLTDGHGRTVDCKNTVVIMTSNIGSQFIQEAKNEEEMRKLVSEALRHHFKPEFLNRIDDIIIFHPLSEEQLKRIIDIQLGLLQRHLAQKKMHITLTPAAREMLVTLGYDPAYGARPLKRTIQREILNPLAMKILEGQFKEGDTVQADVEGGRLVFRRMVEAEAA